MMLLTILAVTLGLVVSSPIQRELNAEESSGDLLPKSETETHVGNATTLTEQEIIKETDNNTGSTSFFEAFISSVRNWEKAGLPLLSGWNYEEPRLPSWKSDGPLIPGWNYEEPRLPSWKSDGPLIPGWNYEEPRLPSWKSDEPLIPYDDSDEPLISDWLFGERN